ncbi:DUF2500 domain-containing protein [Fictibacillus aquaticus]|uniref:DUF2500 domain-containing protein n=1 Tax=Fictibacillus aquaticus TaxID=2021314 RepID=A0A235FDR5_9BACL|nr:DUF2500 domain-containing protein [Fictibacillus aquaticus]OYD59540.1 hypothetical protein CGZ90_06510 [Fictibacillus aquaticus]
MEMFFEDMPAFFIVFFVLFILVATIIFGLFFIAIIKGIMEWSSNNKKPALTVDAIVVSKRQNVSGGAGDTSASTNYFCTFEVKSGDRVEFPLSGNEYGLLAEGDKGELTFQGTRYKSFSRPTSVSDSANFGAGI